VPLNKKKVKNIIKSQKFSFIFFVGFMLTQALSVQSQIIGNNVEGTLTDLCGGSMNAIRYQCHQNMTVTKMYAKIGISGSGKIKLAIYSDNNGSPDSFLMGTNELTNPGTGWKSFDLTSGLELTSGTWYHLVLWANNTGYGINYTMIEGGNGTPFRYDLGYGAWPDLFGTFVSWAEATYCIYAETNSGNPEVAPVALNDTIKAFKNTVALIKPLINDYDINGDVLHIVSWTDPLHGTLDTLQGGLKFQYTPVQDYLGSDGFSYTITDGISETSANVIINIEEIDWSVEVANMIINTRSTHMNWDYTVGLLLEGVLRVYERTGDQRYLNFINEWAQYHITDDGTIMADASTEIEINSLDNIMPGFTILHLYKETGNERFKLAADRLRARFDTYPRNPDGCFWHMTDLNGELWLDGLYMGMPFLTTYGKMFDDEDYAYSEAIHQFKLHIDYLMDKETGLLLHAYDYDGSEPWALPPYNRSPYAWGRAIGWVMMGLTEILDIIPENFPQRDSIVAQYKTVLRSLATYQDPGTGLWYQVIDHQNDPGNWLETSCSMMYVYSMSRAIKKGFLEESYKSNVESGYMGVLTKISEDESNMVYLKDISEGTGVSSDIQYYFDRARNTNDNHGLGTFLIMNELLAYNNLPWLPVKVQEIQTRGISIYPNPCRDYAEMSTEGLEGNIKIDIYSITGMKIKTIHTYGQSGTALLDMSGLPQGIYVLRIQTNSHVYTEKLIKQ
jgi:unsaturated rhamnogalacturonyl hydrolase